MRRLALLMLVLLPACSLFGPNGVYELRVVNETERPFYFFAVPTSNPVALDPAPFIPLDELDGPRVEVGESVDIENVKPSQAVESGVALFLYVLDGSDSTRVVLSDLWQFAPEEVVRQSGRLVVETRHHQPQ